LREFGGGIRYRLSYLSALKLLPRSKVGTSTAYCTHLVGRRSRRSRSPRLGEDIGLGALVSVSQVPLVAEERGDGKIGRCTERRAYARRWCVTSPAVRQRTVTCPVGSIRCTPRYSWPRLAHALGTSQVPKGRTWIDEEVGYIRLVVVLIYPSAASQS